MRRRKSYFYLVIVPKTKDNMEYFEFASFPSIFLAHMRANAIYRCFISRHINLLVRAYIAYVRSILEYNSIVWSPHLKQDIDAIDQRVQRRFRKRLRGCGNYSYSERLRLLTSQS